jgi:putative ABC transport system substrate-binding protein
MRYGSHFHSFDNSRRAIVGGLLTTALCPLPGIAQPRNSVPVVGFLNSGREKIFEPYVSAFQNGLQTRGFHDGRNVKIEYRFADGDYRRLPILITELLKYQVDVLVCTGGDVSALAAKSASVKIPTVFSNGEDPVSLGLVQSIRRPGANFTGVSFYTTPLEAKRFQLIAELVPGAKLIGALVNSKFSNTLHKIKVLENAAKELGRQIKFIDIANQEDLESAFVTFSQLNAGAVMVTTDPIFNNWRGQLVSLAENRRIPTIYYQREFTSLGGLISYGTDFADVYRLVGIYTARILNGEKPSEMPVLQPTTFDLSVNIKTARSLGLEVPPAISALASEIIGD